MLVKCKIEKYCPQQLKPPYQFITVVDCIEVDKPENDRSGTIFATNLMLKCEELGYQFRFYSICSDTPGIEYTITIRGELEDIMGIY